MQTRVATNRNPAAPGVIDSIADGLTAALTFPLLMVVPLLLDAYYWVGWRFTPAPLTSPIKHWLDDSGGSDVQSTVNALDRLGRSDMTTLASQLTPAFLPGVARGDVYEVWTRPDLDLHRWWLTCFALLGMIVLSAGIFAAYYVPLADAAIGRERPIRGLPKAILRTWIRYLGMLVLIAGLLALGLGPLALLWGISAAAGIGLGVILAPIMVLGGLALLVFLIFTPEAIVVADVGPLRAMNLSVNVVRRNLWPTVGISAATMIISLGLGEIWSRLASSPPGLLVAVIANAFFAGGLAMAGMMFFNNRFRLLPQATPSRR